MRTLRMLTVMVGIAFISAAQVHAGEAPASAANPFFGSLSKVSAAELPAKSAELVSKADSKSRIEATVNVVKAALGLNPAAAAEIVGAIAKSTPEMASVAASTAAGLVPNQIKAIARAAAVAAPAYAGRIVEAVCRVMPAEFKEIADAVAVVAPEQSKAILSGLSAAIPGLQEPIAKILSDNKGVNSSVSDVLALVPADLPVSAPQFGPPYVPVPPSPVNLDPGSGGQVPTGGRNYVTPPPP